MGGRRQKAKGRRVKSEKLEREQQSRPFGVKSREAVAELQPAPFEP